MKLTHTALLVAAMATTAAPAISLAADAGSPLPIRYKLRADWIYSQYSKDAFNCWNDGVAATCGQPKGQFEGENEGRLMFERELNDVFELRLQLGAEAYHNTGWTERSARATGPSKPRPKSVAHLFDTWIGLNHIDYGTVRLGTGLNPFQEASGQMDGNTDLGGKELLERMVAYDSPVLWGDKVTGVSMKLAMYDGARYRKARHEQAPEDKNSAARTKGVALLFDATINGAITAKLAMFSERQGARKYYGTGPLDGRYELQPGATVGSSAYNEDNPAQTRYLGGGAKVRARGVALDLSYQANTFRIGGEIMQSRRLRNDNLVTANFAADGYGTGYVSNAAAIYFSTWHGPWSLWAKAYSLEYKLSDAGLLNSSSDWLYANSTQTVVKASGEVGYALTEKIKAIAGMEWMNRDFKESPLAMGMCATGRLHPCYDPQGLKVFAGVRSNF